MARAQEGESSASLPSLNDDFGFASKGARVSVTKPFMSYELVQNVGARKLTEAGDTGSAVSIGVGFVFLPIRAVGFTADLAGASFGPSVNNQYTLRASGNLAAAISEKVYTKAGLNISDTTGEKTLNGLSTATLPGLGLQAGVGYQLSRQFGFEVQYVFMSQALKQSGDLFEQGAEVGISGTF